MYALTDGLFLYRISTTGTVTNLGTASGGSTAIAAGTYGANYFDSEDNFYVVANAAPGRIYRFPNVSTLSGTSTRTPIFLAASAASTFNDGARCPTIVNFPPVAVNDAGTVIEDTPLTGNVLTNDSDPNLNPTLTVAKFTIAIAGVVQTFTAVQKATIPNVGTLTLNADGSYIFTPAVNYTGAIPVATYTLSDGEFTATATLTLTMTAVNDPPVAVNDTGTVTLDTPLTGNVLTNDSDPEGSTRTLTQFTIAGVTGTFSAGKTANIPNVGTLIISSTGVYIFTPAANYTGAIPVATYMVSDGDLTATATLTLTIKPVNNDFDGDGIPNHLDLDYDNDGIPNDVESPGCFYTAIEANVIARITSSLTSPDDNQSDLDIQMLHDGASTLTFNFDASQNYAGATLFRLEYPTPVPLTSVTIENNTTFGASTTAKLQGSTDGLVWQELSTADVSLATTVNKVFPVQQNAGRYRYYRIVGVASVNSVITTTIGEISSVLAATYQRALAPKPDCADDFDGDGIPNHLDLDSDGDGCPDAYEAGVSTDPATSVLPGPCGTNGLADSVETTPDSGIINYGSTYSFYALTRMALT
jgi:hypothetical protein